MLQINMADVMNVIGSLTPYLIAIGVIFVLALIITFAVNKKTVKEVATRKIIHSESWLVALVGIVVAVSMMLSGPLSTLLNNATATKYMLSDATVSKANDLAKEVQSEAITMLKNDDSNLPLSNKKAGTITYKNNSKDYDDFQDGEHFLQLSKTERDMIDLVTKNFDKVTFDVTVTNTGDTAGKIQLTDADGPASLNNNFTGVGSIGFPASTAFACTWNKDLAKQFGEMIGDMAHDMRVAGWYAPAMNIHRGAFSGRTFEYFSEDSLLSGVMASNEIAGAKEKGVYSFMKHFALNDQETNRTNMVCTWADEQAIREIYLKPFEMSVKEGGAQAVMSSFNYIGYTYAGASNNLLNTVLRDEWGFKGFVLTDYFGDYGYQNGDQEIRNGNDSMLATTKITNHITDKSATSVKAMRTATHNILYTAANSWQYADGEPKVDTPIWKTAMYVAWGVTAVLVIALEALAIKRYMDRKKAKAEVSA